MLLNAMVTGVEYSLICWRDWVKVVVIEIAQTWQLLCWWLALVQQNLDPCLQVYVLGYLAHSTLGFEVL